MASVVEKSPRGTIYKCPQSVRVPEEDLLTFLFGECERELEMKPPLLEAGKQS